VAIAVDSSTAWVEDTAFNANVTTGTFSPGAGTVLVALVASYNRTSPTMTNSGTALTWTMQQAVDNGGFSVSIYTAVNSSAQSNITATFEDLGTAYPIPALKVYVLSGASTSSPVGTKGSGSSAAGSVGVDAGNTTVADAWAFTIGFDTDLNGSPSSSNMTASSAYNGTYVDAVAGYKTLTSSGSSMTTNLTRSGTLTNGWRWAQVEIKPGGTVHDASATRATTATTTAAATKDAVVGATSAVTSTQTAAADLERVASATSAVTASLSAAASVEQAAAVASSVASSIVAAATLDASAGASLSATATVTADADVSTPGVVSIAASLSVTGSITGAAALEAVVGAALAATATTSAEATTSTVTEAAATRPVTATVSASANVLVGGIGDPGSMHAFDVAGATMSPAGSGAATMRTVLVGFNTATMQAVLDDSASAPLLGVPVFVGADDPVTLGLVALTTPHVWFHSGTVTVREG